MAAASLAKVAGLSLRELYESTDPNFLLLAAEVVDSVVTTRTEIAKEAKRNARSS